MASDARLSNQLDLFGYELKAVREAFVPAEVAEVVPMPRTLPPRPPLRSVHLLSAELGAAEIVEPPVERDTWHATDHHATADRRGAASARGARRRRGAASARGGCGRVARRRCAG